MLKVNVNGKEGIIEVEGNGPLCELMADVTSVLRCMYEGVNENQKEEFKDTLKHLVDNEIYLKTEEEMDELTKKQQEEIKVKLKKELEELINGLFGKKE